MIAFCDCDARKDDVLAENDRGGAIVAIAVLAGYFLMRIVILELCSGLFVRLC